MKYLYYILIFLTIFQDLPLAIYIGEYGKSIVGILSIIIIAICLLRNKKIIVNSTLKSLLILLLYLLLFDTILLIATMISGRDTMFLGEDIVVKTIKLFMYYFTNVVYILTLYQIGESIKEQEVLKPFYYTYIFLFIILLIEMLTLPKAFSFIHATRPEAYNRIRLFTSESSNTSTLIFVFFVTALMYAKKYKGIKSVVIVLIMLIPFLISTTSKALFVMFVASVILMFVFNKKIKIKYKLLMMAFLICGIALFSENVLLYFNLAYTSSTTLYTRGYTFFIALIISVVIPIGVGHVYYLQTFTQFLINNLQKITKYFPSFNASELNYVLTSGTDKNISAYSGVMQYGMYWGIIGNFFFLLSIWKGIKKAIKNNPILCFGFVGIALSLFTTVSFDNKFEVWAFLFVLLYYNDKIYA